MRYLEYNVLPNLDIGLCKQIIRFEHCNFGAVVLLTEMTERDMLSAVLHQI